jgi:bacterioferritin (cytochrome b1)
MTPMYDRANLIELLTERVEFERAAVVLYDTLLAKLRQGANPTLSGLVPQLRLHRDDEVEHAEWLEGLVTKLGGAPRHSPLSQAVARESRALESVVQHADGEILPAFHAMLSSELMDFEGWELLLKIARDIGDNEAVPELERRVERERAHLELIRQAMQALMADSVTFHGAPSAVASIGVARRTPRARAGVAAARGGRAKSRGAGAKRVTRGRAARP